MRARAVSQEAARRLSAINCADPRDRGPRHTCKRPSTPGKSQTAALEAPIQALEAPSGALLVPCPTPSDSPFARCYDLGEDLHAAIVLERLTYWWGRSTRMFKGTEWRAKPRAELARECRMSEKQCRRALEILKIKSLIETGQHIFGQPILGHGLRHWSPRI